MKINVTILWIDDNRDFVESLRPQLERWMDSQGLGLNIEWHRGEAGIYDVLRSKDIELIVLDYKLRGTRNGDEIVRELRSRDFYEDVIFYSQQVSAFELFNPPLEGVLFVGREDARERIIKLFEIKIQRASDLATVRGWIVADAIELETLLGEVLCKTFQDMQDQFYKRIYAEEHLLDFGKKHKILNGIVKDHIAKLRQSNGQSEKLRQLDACKEILDRFPPEIIDVRNTLAHQIAEIGTDGVKRLKTRTRSATEVTFTSDDCVIHRKNIRKHHDNLKLLESLV